MEIPDVVAIRVVIGEELGRQQPAYFSHGAFVRRERRSRSFGRGGASSPRQELGIGFRVDREYRAVQQRIFGGGTGGVKHEVCPVFCPIAPPRDR